MTAYVPVAAVGVLLSLVPLAIGDSRYLMGLAIGAVLFAAYAVGFNVIFGATAQLFLCNGALAGIAGYSSVIASDRLGVPFPLAILAATALASALGGMFSWIAVRRRLDVIFVGIVTLTFSLGFAQLLLGQRDLSGGETGLRVQAASETFLRDQIPPYYVFLALLVGYLTVFRLIQRSHLGWAFRALRDDEVAAELAGIDVARHKIYAGLIGAAMLGLAGALFAHHEGFISPSTYAFQHIDVRILVILAFGGINSLLGPVVGAIVFAVIDEQLRGLSQLRVAVYGAILLVLFLGFRSGVVPTVTGLLRRRR